MIGVDLSLMEKMKTELWCFDDYGQLRKGFIGNTYPCIKVFHADYPDFPLYMPIDIFYDCIAEKIKKGSRIWDAYEECGCKAIRPPEILKATVKLHCYQQYVQDPYTNTLTIKKYGEWFFLGAFYSVLTYLNALGQPTAGRLMIDEGVIVPSLEEQGCMRMATYYGQSLSEAYSSCDCGDIIPRFPNAMTCIAKAFNASNAPMYNIINSCYLLNKPIPPVTPPMVTTLLEKILELLDAGTNLAESLAQAKIATQIETLDDASINSLSASIYDIHPELVFEQIWIEVAKVFGKPGGGFIQWIKDNQIFVIGGIALAALFVYTRKT